MTLPMLPKIYIMGILFILVGSIFRIQHWPEGTHLYGMGAIMELAYLGSMFTEISTSAYIDKKSKTKWIAIYSLVYAIIYAYTLLIFTNWYQYFYHLGFLIPIVISGAIYIKWGRKKIISGKRKFDHIEFDSIDVK